jgi:hypothetical protein
MRCPITSLRQAEFVIKTSMHTIYIYGDGAQATLVAAASAVVNGPHSHLSAGRHGWRLVCRNDLREKCLSERPWPPGPCSGPVVTSIARSLSRRLVCGALRLVATCLHIHCHRLAGMHSPCRCYPQSCAATAALSAAAATTSSCQAPELCASALDVRSCAVCCRSLAPSDALSGRGQSDSSK